jgi:tagatose-6-phosphate ketose/aldose isomerase
VLVLPPATNDRSLAMTSSFTSMGLAAVGLGWLANGADPADTSGLGRQAGLASLRRAMEPVQAGARRVMEEHGDLLERFASLPFDRACYLGSDALAGVMHEGALKMLEMTAGSVITACDSFLGVRHGPQVFINKTCAVVACLSSDPRVRRYEMDLLAELRAKGQGCGTLAISAFDDPALRGITDDVVVLSPTGERMDDSLRVFSDIVACQLLAFHKSRACGLMPDNPSPGGVINRVVQGVTIYDP